MPESTPAATNEVTVDNLEDFVTILVNWHNLRVARLNHLLDTPEGVEVELDDHPPLVLQGDVLSGFKLGISIALNQLGRLPLVIDKEVNPDE